MIGLKEYTKTIDLGKVDFYGHGRKSCAAGVLVAYRLEAAKQHNDKTILYWEFSASGRIWNHKHTDIGMGGQCLDALRKYPLVGDNAVFCEVYALWKRWHLNGLRAGSPAQREALKAFKFNPNKTTWAWYDATDVNPNTDTFGRHITDREEAAKAAELAGHYVRREVGDWQDQAALYLMNLRLYSDRGYIVNGNPYKYGSGWVVEELPEEVKAQIRALVGITKEDEERAEKEVREEMNRQGAAA